MSTFQPLALAERGLPAGYSARPAAVADAADIADMLNAWSQALSGEDRAIAADLVNEWQSPGQQLKANTRVVWAPNGAVAGYVILWNLAPHVQLEQGGFVHPDDTGRGIGTYLLAWIESRARETLYQAPQGARVTLTDWVINLDTASRNLLRDQGHSHVRDNWRMVIDLDPATPPPAPEWPAGTGVRHFVPGQDDRATLGAIRAAFRDHWGTVERPFEEDLERWTHFCRTDPEFDPSLWFLAVAGDEVIGTALSRMRITEAPEMGWIYSLGVLRPWRRQGLAGALLRHCFAELWQRGRRKVGLGVDAGSLTNALHLYEKAGMRPDMDHSYQIWEKELRPGVELSTQAMDKW